MDVMVIKEGTIVTPYSMYQADVKVVDGVITAIAKDIEPEGTVIDAKGKLVLPGAVDVHTHLELPFNGTTSADDYYDGTVAAAFGGTTTVFNYLNQIKGESLHDRYLRDKQSAEKKACIDYAFHFGITNWNETTKQEMKEAVNDGVTSFKVYTTYREDNMMMDEAGLCEILAYGKEENLLICVHAENNPLLEYRRKKYAEEGHTSPWYHYLSRDEMVEAQADKTIVYFAEKMNAPVYIVHLANAEGYEEVKKAKEKGIPVLAETCPQYLEFTSDVYKREDAEKFVCSPPMKGEESRLALREGVKHGVIDVMATDHCPFTLEQKALGKDDFRKIPNGCMGVENRYPYMLSMAVNGELSYSDVVRMCCYHPAKYFGCETKGSIEPGKDADLVIFNPEGEITVTADNMHTKAEYTIWEGVTTSGQIEKTIARGKIITDGGTFLGHAGDGRYLKRKKSSIFKEGLK